MDDAVRQAKERRLAHLEVQAAQYGIDVPAHIATEIADLRRELGAADPTGEDPAMTLGSISRQEFNQLVARVDRVVWALLISTAALTLSSVSFILVLVKL